MNKIIISNHDFYFYDSESDNVVQYLKHGHLYSSENYAIALMYLKNIEGTIIDCGANIGTFSFNPVLDGKSVLLIEAANKNVECLKATFKNFSNAIIEQAVVLDSVKKCDFLSDGGPFGMVTMNSDGVRTSSTIDQICDKYKIEQVALIKCDIEGYEIEALLGSTGILEKNKPLIISEINGYCLWLRNKTPKDMLDTIDRINYYAFFRDRDGSLIPINSSDKFPFCVIDIVCIHKDNIHKHIGDIVYRKYLTNDNINNIIDANITTANKDCMEYFNTLK